MNARIRILDRAPAGWDALVREDPEAAPAHRVEVHGAFADVLPGGSSRYVVFERDGTLFGGAAFVVQRRAGLEWLHGQPWLLPGSPIARGGARGAVDEAIAAGVAAWMRDGRVAGGEWVFYRPETGAPSAAVLDAAPGRTSQVETAVVELEAGAPPSERVGKRLRQYLRNAPATLRFAEEPSALEELYVLHLRQARGWRGYQPLPLELSRRLLGAGGDARAARLFTLRDGERLLAGTLFLDHPRELFAWWSGIHPRARGHHVFPVLLWNAVEWAAHHGRRRVNLGGSAGRGSLEAFKEALGARLVTVPVRWLAPVHAPWWGRGMAALQEWRRRGRARGVEA